MEESLSASHGGLSRASVAHGMALDQGRNTFTSDFSSARPPTASPRRGVVQPSYGLVDPFCSFPKARAGISGVCLMWGTHVGHDLCDSVGEGKQHTSMQEGKVLMRENYQ